MFSILLRRSRTAFPENKEPDRERDQKSGNQTHDPDAGSGTGNQDGNDPKDGRNTIKNCNSLFLIHSQSQKLMMDMPAICLKWTLAVEDSSEKGKNGIGKTGEGDAKTPIGTLRVLSAFGVKPNPGTTMPYIDVTSSTYACDDSCEYYNQIIDTAAVHHQCGGEDMCHIVPQYNYGIATDFNKACVYPNGSNIFIHVKGTKPYTGGCIAFDEDRMFDILRKCDSTLVITVRE